MSPCTSAYRRNAGLSGRGRAQSPNPARPRGGGQHLWRSQGRCPRLAAPEPGSGGESSCLGSSPGEAPPDRSAESGWWWSGRRVGTPGRYGSLIWRPTTSLGRPSRLTNSDGSGAGARSEQPRERGRGRLAVRSRRPVGIGCHMPAFRVRTTHLGTRGRRGHLRGGDPSRLDRQDHRWFTRLRDLSRWLTRSDGQPPNLASLAETVRTLADRPVHLSRP